MDAASSVLLLWLFQKTATDEMETLATMEPQEREYINIKFINDTMTAKAHPVIWTGSPAEQCLPCPAQHAALGTPI
jgi:hypothetical protein